MKYIVTESAEGKKEIFIFSRRINHDCMAEVIAGIRNQSFGNWERVRRKPVSAGFVEGGECKGKSESLNLFSNRVEDTALLKSYEGCFVD